MLFRTSGFTSKFCLVGLDADELEEITKLITDNGGEICTRRKPPVIMFGNHNSVSEAGEPIFHINFIRECARHQKIINLIDFIIGSPGYFGCLQSIFATGQCCCQLDLSDIHPLCTSTQIETGSQINGTNEFSRTQDEHNYAHGDSPDTQEANVSVEKRPCNTEHVTEVLPRDSSQFPTESQFLPAESQPEKDLSLVESSRNSNPFTVPESLRDSEFLLDESRQNGESRLQPESLTQSTDVFEKTTQEGDSPEEANRLTNDFETTISSAKSKRSKTVDPSFVPIRLPLLSRPEKTNSDQEMVEVPEAARFEELECDQEEEIVLASSSLATGAEPTDNQRVGGARTKEQLEELERFRIQSSDSDDTDFEPDLSQRGAAWIKRSASSPKGKRDEKDKANNQAQSSGSSAIVDLTIDSDEVIEASSGEENAGRVRCARLDQLQEESQPSTSRAEKSTANDGRSTTVSSTSSRVSIRDDDSDSSSDEAETPGLAQGEAAAKRSTERTNGGTAEARKKMKRLPLPTRNIVPWEQRQMVKYLIDNDFISEAKGLRVWKQMIEDGYLKHRTAQSLNNHFRRVLLPTIHCFSMDERSLKKFQRLQT